jgi:two-component system OmpR family response regulator
MRILVAEDDLHLSSQIKAALLDDGRAVDIANMGEDVLHLGATESYDLIVLDIGLPGQDGMSILRAWRESNVDTPVLILTARDTWSDRVDGLDAGADDYLAKPFHMKELSARIRAILRRRMGFQHLVIRAGTIEYDTRTGTVLRSGNAKDLTGHEVSVLDYLLHNRGRFVSRTELSEHIYEFDGDRDSNTIAVFVARLRQKLGADLIETSRGKGYRISDEP